MNINTFFNIYYKHRFQKTKNIIKKIYLILIVPLNYIIEKVTLQKFLDLDKYQKENKQLFKKNLNYLFQHFNSDKGKRFLNQYARFSKRNGKLLYAHNYGDYYHKFLKKFKNKKINILEIGAFKGNATASFFFYFNNSKIYSADLYPDLFRFKSERISSFKLDNSIEQELQNLPKKLKYDIIIEDAGHYLKDQIISVFKLFPKLNKKGFFVVEELDFPDTRQDMNISLDQNTLYNILKLILKKKNFYSKYINITDKKYFLKNFKSIKICQGRFNKIVFIQKK